MKARLTIVILISLLLLAVQVKPADSRSYYSERFDVVIDLQKDASFIVTEKVTFYFEGGPYTFAFRDLAMRELDSLDIIEARMDGEILPEGVEPGQVEIKRGGDPVKVTWHFLPLSNALRTFELTYRVAGNVRRVAGLDGISWRAIPEEHEYEIRASTITVNYPLDITPAGEPALDGSPYTLEQQPGQIVFQARDIPRDTVLVVDVRFPQGSLITAPPVWQSRQIERSQQSGAALPYALAAGGGILAVSLVGLAVFRRKNMPDFPGSIPPGIITAPPDELTPAQAGFLLNRTTATLNHLFAALMDLTRRGWLRMQEVEGRGLFKVRDFILTREKSGGGLQLHEIVLVDLLFKTRGGYREKVKLSEIGAKFSSRLSVFARGLRSELAAKDLILNEKLRQRSRLAGMGFTLVFIGLPAVLIAAMSIGVGDQPMVFWGTVLLGAGLGLVAAAVAFWIQSLGWPVLSQNGAARIGRWSSFRAYLKDMIRSDAALREEWLTEFLPFAVAFGLGEQWVKAFKDRGLSTALPWVLTASGGYADGVAVTAAISASSASGGSGGGGGGGGSSGAG